MKTKTTNRPEKIDFDILLTSEVIQIAKLIPRQGHKTNTGLRSDYRSLRPVTLDLGPIIA
jgi:hypothetical protein